MDISVIAAAAPWYSSIVSINPGTIISTFLNTLLIMLLYRIFLHKKVCDVLEKRRAETNEQMDKAQEAKDNALKAEREYLDRLAVSKEEAQQILAEAKQKAEANGEKIVAAANNEAVLIRTKAQEAIEKEKKRAVNEIKDQISELVIMAAEAVTEKEINEADNKTLIESFLVKIGEQ